MLGQNIGRVGLPDMSSGGRPSLTLDFVGIPVLNERITFSRTSGATWFSPDGVLKGVDFSASSVAIGTGSKSFTLDATAGVNRYWTVGDLVRVSQQSNSANFMEGTVTSYTASTQVLVIDVTSTGGSGTIASWRVSSHMPRFDYNPTTLATRGLLIEEARTNSIRNNTMQGAVAGTPGTLPTNWVVVAGGLGTLTQQVVGTGTSAGITYIDIRLNGTTSTTSVGYSFEATTQIAAAQNQTWTSTFWAALQAGSLTNISTVENRIIERDATGTSIGSTITDFKASFTSTLIRTTTTRTLANASAGRVTNDICLSFSSGVAIDITLRIGLPQLELGAFATSVIPTTTTALTRSADVASVNTLSPWYNQTAGTIVCQFRKDVGTTGRLIVVDNGSGALTTNGINLDLTSATQARTEGFAGGAAQWDLRQTIALGSTQTTAVAYATNDIGFSANGASPTTDNVATIASTGISVMALANWQGALQLNGWLRRVTVYPRRLSNAELQSLTS